MRWLSHILALSPALQFIHYRRYVSGVLPLCDFASVSGDRATMGFPRYAVRLEVRDLGLKLLPVPGVNTGNCTAGVFQKNPVANDLQHHKTATRLVVVYAPYDWSLTGVLHHIHIDILFSLHGRYPK
jgi:hypothetical protein